MTVAPAVPIGSVATYKLRRGRVTASQADALTRLWPMLGVDLDGSRLDLTALFGHRAPVVLEIGFGMGEATAALAAAQPERDVLAVDVHTPGVGTLLKRVESGGLTNVRVAQGDARVLLSGMLPDAGLDEVRLFFPDPWPKTRHHKRRLVTPGFVELLDRCLATGGRVHLATDWAPYAEQARRLFEGHPAFALLSAPPSRPITRFEQQGHDAGRSSYDVVAVKCRA